MILKEILYPIIKLNTQFTIIVIHLIKIQEVKINYADLNWETLKDPDGNIRNLKNEKDFKI